MARTARTPDSAHLNHQSDSSGTDQLPNMTLENGAPGTDSEVQEAPAGSSTPENQVGFDLSLWHRYSCKPFILATVRGTTAADTQSLTQSYIGLQQHLKSWLERRHEDEGNLSFLNLSRAIIHNSYDEPTREDTSLSKSYMLKAASSSTSSIRSAGSNKSFASQVSNSDLNDVEQSSHFFLGLQKEALGDLTTLENWSRSGQPGFLKLFRTKKDRNQGTEDHNATKTLRMSIARVEDIIVKARPEMATLGFTDVGLQITNNGQRFEKEVRNPLADMRREGWGATKIIGRRQKSKSLDDDFSRLTSITTEIAADIERCLKWAISTRDAYLKAACDVMDVVARASAAQLDIHINDRHDNQLLLERTFGTRNLLLDSAFNVTLRQLDIPQHAFVINETVGNPGSAREVMNAAARAAASGATGESAYSASMRQYLSGIC